MKAELIVVRKLDGAIYKSSGGGQSVVYSRHPSGPRGLLAAEASGLEERRSAISGYGNVGCGRGWIEAVQKGGKPGSGVVLGDPRYLAVRRPPAGASLEWWRAAVKRTMGEF